MKTILLMAVALALSPGTAFTQHHGSIGIFADSLGVNCDLTDTTPGLCELHVVHVNTTGAVGAKFAAPKPSCFTAPYLTDHYVFAVNVGDSQLGIFIDYGQCLSGAIHILDMVFMCQGDTPQCCMYSVLGHPETASGQVEVYDCGFVAHPVGGWTSVINPIPSCCCSCLPVQESTWGKVKSLYVR